MSIREAIAKRPGVTSTFVIVVIAGALIFAVKNSPVGPTTASDNVYYTIDDGKTQFVDKLELRPPFDHDGKPAYRIWMFTCDGGKTMFPGYLERFNSDAKKRLDIEDQNYASGKGRPPQTGMGDYEVKKPGNENMWASRNSAAGGAIVRVQCPAGGGDSPEVVMP